MPTTQNNRKILDTKQWEILAPGRFNSATAKAVAAVDHIRPLVYIAEGVSTSNSFLYDPLEDGWLACAPGTGSWSTGSCATASAWSTGSTLGVSSLTATAGTTSTFTTNQTLTRDLRNWKVHIIEGPNAGQTLQILSNTIGANSVITVATQASAFTTATKFRFCTPRFWVLQGGSTPFGFACYDYATDTWLSPSTTGGVTLTGDAGFVSTPSWHGTDYVSFATGTATSATSTTLVNSAKTWTTSQWVNYQIRITGGTGAGQIRTITANDATSVTVAAWTTTPDNTSTYSIEGNDDFLYFFGGSTSSTSALKYTISTNTWSNLTARSVGTGNGSAAGWIFSAPDSDWNNESSIINGRRIYSLTGNSTTIYYYDIPSNSWVLRTPAPTGNIATASTGSAFVAVDGDIYISPGGISGTAGLRWFKYNCPTNDLMAWKVAPNVFGTTNVNGHNSFVVYYRDGSTKIPFIYKLNPTGLVLLRAMVY